MKKQEDWNQRIQTFRGKIKDVISQCGNHSLSEDSMIHIQDTLAMEYIRELAIAKQEMVERVRRYEKRYPIMSKVEQLGMNSIDYRNLGYNQAITDIINELSNSER